ncbi:hypothetical protein ACS5PN_12620 [Roseateles sp. NT4]|uniref:hypothetical protein n=1 Tax=Roseateles sp. NT4 TaxID=3453715 RepID=UPI003EED4885
MSKVDMLLLERTPDSAPGASGPADDFAPDLRIEEDIHSAFQASLEHQSTDEGADSQGGPLTAYPVPARLRNAIEAGRAICYLDHMVGELIDAIPPSKPWQRRLLTQLATAEREIQVLRMTIALNRNAQEIHAAGLLVHATLASAHMASIKGRAPLLMKGEMRFAHEISKRIKSALEVICDVPRSRRDAP